MGIYINPLNMTKEEFLEKHGTRLKDHGTFAPQHRIDALWEERPKDMAIVVLVENRGFRAAAVAFSKRELEAFIGDADDMRVKHLYHDPLDVLGTSTIGMANSELLHMMDLMAH